MEALLKAGVVQLQDDQSIQQYITPINHETEGWKNLWLFLLIKYFSLTVSDSFFLIIILMSVYSSMRTSRTL